MQDGLVAPMNEASLVGLPDNKLAVDMPTAAALLDVHAETIRREIVRGNLRAAKIGRCWRIRVSELHAYLRRCEARNSKFSA